MRRWKLLAIAAAIFPAGFALLGAAFCSAMLHVPRRAEPEAGNATVVSISARDGVQLFGWWSRGPAPSERCVLLLHGIGDSHTGSLGFAPLFVREGYTALAPDSRAHGRSGGEFVTYGLLEKYDVIAWTQWMRSQGCKKIYGLGESLGASILIEASAVDSVFRAIAAECAYADLQEVGEYRMRHLTGLPVLLAGPFAKLVVASGMMYAHMVDGFDFRDVSPVKSIARSTTPVLLIHGLDDVATPAYNSRALAAANHTSLLWLVPHAGHIAASSVEPEQFRARVLNWFANH